MPSLVLRCSTAYSASIDVVPHNLPAASGRFTCHRRILLSSAGIKGTIGYAAPEYGMGGGVSTHGDVYSYGILLLEMFTGKRPTNELFKDDLNLHNFAKTVLPGRVMQIVDQSLQSQEITEKSSVSSWRGCSGRQFDCLTSIIQLGVICSDQSPRDRMSMREVSLELFSIKDKLLQSGMSSGSPAESSRLVAVQWVWVGRCINWESLFTEKLISGRVKDKYCKAPITLRYSVESTDDEPSASFRETDVERGVVTSLAPSILVLAKYGMGGQESTQGDVCSYGILLLEIFTGRRPIDELFKDDLNLHKFAKMVLPGQVMEIVDQSILHGKTGAAKTLLKA
ncbi:hypothetical protein F0562_001072 [Nyssa sinensis]|uniref:non-specific serine/threonine protein kinase n=1 Tax=Nyssa sinensis TaxID=561372 RepID=A0A5J5C275_9ASTE|nr:hypothetical protein F0562_001072 [Nyssa sinensis]